MPQKDDPIRISDIPDIADEAEEADEGRALALAFKAGERNAYEAIYERYRPLVNSICRRRLSAHDAEEAAQETFLRVFTALDRFNGSYKLEAWIARIARNVCLDSMRSSRRRPADPTPDEAFIRIPEPIEASDPLSLTLRAYQAHVVRRTIEALPRWHRAAIVLRDYEGHSYLEIASHLNLSESQVKALIHRARKGFRRRWLNEVSHSIAS